ncbi:MAG TPA: GNAT family N-acetyltransferase [Bacteroidia bacterium]|nr:GNAT family N-acetyltransferase [Bacteroidia bacterium]
MLTISFSPFPILYTERLVLRQLTQDDAEDFFYLRTSPKMRTYSHRAPDASVEVTKALIDKINTIIDNGEGINWAISLREDTKLIGVISFWRIFKEQHRAEMGYTLHHDYQRQGIMNEAAVAILEYGFKTLQLHTVEARVNPENLPSIKVLERNGFVKEGHFKEDIYYNGEYYDTAVYSLLNTYHK